MQNTLLFTNGNKASMCVCQRYTEIFPLDESSGVQAGPTMHKMSLILQHCIVNTLTISVTNKHPVYLEYAYYSTAGTIQFPSGSPQTCKTNWNSPTIQTGGLDTGGA